MLVPSTVNGPMLLRVGQDSLHGAFSRYIGRFDLLEVSAQPGVLPRTGRLHEWREEAPEGFSFSVVLGDAVGRLQPGEELDTALEAATRAVAALQADWVLLQTGPAVTPSQRHRRWLEELARRLPRDPCRVAWEPRGLWEPEDEERIGVELDMVVVRDLRRRELPPGPVAYTRLLALGTGARVSSEAVDVLAERATGLEALYVVVEGQGAWQGAQRLRQLLVDDPFESEPTE